MNDRVHTRVDPLLRQEVHAILNDIGMTESEAIRLFFKQIKIHDGLPFMPVRSASVISPALVEKIKLQSQALCEREDEQEALDFVEGTMDDAGWK